MTKRALFVGVDRYADESIEDLECAVNDATELAGFFRHRAGYDRAEALPNPRNRDEVLARVEGLTHGLGAGDEFVFFFAGHGFTVKNSHVLVCAGDRYGEVAHEWAGLPLEMLKWRTVGAFDRVFLLDACRTDLLAGHRGAAAGMATGTRDLILSGAGDGGAGVGRLTVLCSCDEGQTAGELRPRRHGIFSLAMLELLEEGASAGLRVEVGDEFQERIGERMRALAAGAEMPCGQRPQKMGPRLMLLEGTSDAGAKASAPDVAVMRAEMERMWAEMARKGNDLQPGAKVSRTSRPGKGRKTAGRAKRKRTDPKSGRVAENKRPPSERLQDVQNAESKAFENASVAEAERGKHPVLPVPSEFQGEVMEAEKVATSVQMADAERNHGRVKPSLLREKGGGEKLEPKAYRIPGRVEVEWDWPDGAEAVWLLWRADRTPVSAEDRLAKRILIPRGESGIGRHDIRGYGGATLHFTAYLANRDGQTIGEGVSFSSIGADDRWSIAYTMKTCESPWYLPKSSVLRISIRGSGRDMTGLPGFVVLKRTGGQPLYSKDPGATLIGRIPPSDELRKKVEIPLDPKDHGCHVMVYLDDDDSGLVERIDWKRPRESKI